MGITMFVDIAPLAGEAADDLVGSQADRLFTLKVKPLLASKCLACHGDDPEAVEGGFDMLSRDSLLAGGDSIEHVVVPGDAKRSFLIKAVRWEDPDYEMPPKQNDRLTEEQIGVLRDWINAGAHWPADETQSSIMHAEKQRAVTDAGMIVELSGGLSENWTMRRYQVADLWAFLPVQAKKPPTEGHPIDAFINQRLAEAQITPAPHAAPSTLLRRLTFDLTGLPPTPEAVDAFLMKWEQDAQVTYLNLVDRLLESPHYGERQAQHWLDVTRYADTSGGSNDFERSGVWRYRDYVMRSFNSDKRYDTFIREQIAGDELRPGDVEGSIAVGFLRMGPWEATGMNPAAVIRQQFLDDVVNHVGEVFLAQPLRCAKCHDHKFDPIPTRDYYQFMAVFQDMNQAEIEAPFTSAEIMPDGTQERLRVDKVVKRVEQERAKLDRAVFDAQVAWLVERGYDASQFKFGGESCQNPATVIDEDLAPNDQPIENDLQSADEITYAQVLLDRKKHFSRFLQRYEPIAYTVYTGPPNKYRSSKPRNAIPTKAKELERENDAIHILSGGDLSAPGDRVDAGALSCIESLAQHRYSPAGDGALSARIRLANWIAHPRNPLTARVLVNRIWQQHFAGKGLVATPSNFGYTGARPSHPELLDFLADWFVENGWSIKKLHQLIVTSDAYRRSARHPEPEQLDLADAQRKLLAAYPVRRLHAEEMRDAMLATTGELNPEIGGTPVFPEISVEAALQPRYLQISVGPAYQPSPLPETRHRRSLYAFRMRGLSNPFLEVFNKPNPDLSCERRNSTIVTPQVFSLLNGQQPHDRALALASRLEKDTNDTGNQICRAYQLVYGRTASDAEIQQAIRFIDEQTELQRSHPPTRIDPPKSVKRSMVHERTGVESSWHEPLDVYAETFVPDLKPWDVRPQTRALASFCLVLFNSNEFLYLE